MSLALIAFPLYVEAFRWVSPTGVPAASRQQEAPTATAFGDEDLVISSPEAATAGPPTEQPAQPTDVPPTAEQPAQPTDAPTNVPPTAEQPDTRARETLTPVPTQGPTNTPGGPTDVPTATTVPPTATNAPT
ncbi:MAG TPA: hypothetical protein VFT99_19745, partial [Roseiflexaceae bacterium]|nr:hypothetical protein [Roseiflexaceae bacterium]